MSSEWTTQTIGELISRGDAIVQTGPFGSQLHSYDYVNIGIPVIPTEAIGRGRILDIDVPRVSEYKASELARHRLQLGDILFARRGAQATGLSAIIDERYVGALCGTGVLLLRLNNAVVDPNYISMFLSSENIYKWLRIHAVGAVMPNLNTGIIKAVQLLLPPLEEQRQLAKFIGALDDRVSLLRETNATLEAIAQAFFKSWFVDFDPVRANQQGLVSAGIAEATSWLFPDNFVESTMGLVPNGWRVASLDEVSTVGIGKTPPRKEQQWFSTTGSDVRWVSIRDMGTSGTFISDTSEYLTKTAIERFNVRVVPTHTVLMSFKMTIGRVAITDGEMTTNEAIAHFKVQGNSPLPSEYIYLYLKQFKFDTLSSTSSIADAVNSKTVKSILILLPPDSIVAAFQEHTKVIFEQIKLNGQKIRTISELRDSLLPRLISGQIRISDVEDTREEVAAWA